MNRDFIVKHWYASMYEKFENQTQDVEFLSKVLSEQSGNQSLNILEVACGGGRICVPLAKAGHTVTGFDADEHMLLRCYRRMAGLPNIHCYQAEAATSEWGLGFDVVIMAGNILINIENDMNYKEAQLTFIKNAAASLRTGGHLYLDFDLHYNPAAVFSSLKESRYFEETDELGTTGHIVSYGSVYDPITQVCSGTGHSELTTNSGEKLIISKRWYKHIPTQAQVYNWLAEAGFSIERTYQNFTDEPMPEPIGEATHRAIIWAQKI
ncbi:class I SAM-dependent methyltransferase [Paenibacillus sp. MMS20-IR301]|uniref:class I SAM-dependent methyltransferase n=1 Tax=Paenibacillus sp. MMS20-IR301 TaxID=2895946 RepID=UPI0028EAACDB|nr:class I SAM-dependent methyltransferase [Paenibacillus sp. MMS20-IR301]WNS40807.1 class I SAM-dependent methyltransferase [Paenibacillus sp. MMS20-IR301]